MSVDEREIIWFISLLIISFIVYIFRMNKYKKGFTILELLIVIAIIGILSAIVFVAVGQSRDKAADKAIAENLLSVRNEAGLYFTASQSYGTWGNAATPYGAVTKCPSSAFTAFTVTSANSVFKDTTVGPKLDHSNIIIKAMTEANTRSGGTLTTGGSANRLSNSRCFAMATEWVAMVQLKSNTNKAWCVDSNGASREVTSNAGLSSGFSINVEAPNTARCATS